MKILYKDVSNLIFNHLFIHDLFNLKFVDKKTYELVKIYLSDKWIKNSDKITYVLYPLKSFYEKTFVASHNKQMTGKLLKYLDTKTSLITPINHYDFFKLRKYTQLELELKIKDLENNLAKSLEGEKIVQVAWQTVYEIFEGEKQFNDLPFLDLNLINAQPKDDQYKRLDSIKPEHLTSPIMRGVDQFGRHFFAVLIQKENSVKVFHQKNEGKDWIDDCADESNVFFGCPWIMDGQPQIVFINFVKIFVQQAKSLPKSQ